MLRTVERLSRLWQDFCGLNTKTAIETLETCKMLGNKQRNNDLLATVLSLKSKKTPICYKLQLLSQSSEARRCHMKEND